MCNVCKKTNYVEKYCWFKEGKEKLIFKCSYKVGHSGKFRRIKYQNNQHQASVTEDEISDEHFFMAYQILQNTNPSTWFNDSGCISHMTKHFSTSLRLITVINQRSDWAMLISKPKAAA